MGIVIEPAGRVQRGVERLLAGMAERRMAEIVRQRQRFGQILVEPQRAGDDPRDLRDFEAVGQPHPVVIAVGRDEHLGLVAQAAEGDRMDDAVAVALVIAARTAGQRALERKFAAARPGGIGGEGRLAVPPDGVIPPRIHSTAASAWMRVQS